MRNSVVGSLVVLFVCVSAASRADPVAIVNGGFESPDLAPSAYADLTPPGWTWNGTSRRAVWDISIGWDHWFPNQAPEGDQVGALWAATLSQTLGAVLLPNTTYTLQAEFSHAPGFPSEFTLELLAGGVSLGSDGGFPTIAGIFDTATVVVTTGATHPQLGELLEIRITSTTTESDFDNVRLDTDAIPVDPCAATGGDVDSDGICGFVDNCPQEANADQSDLDSDGIGDACDSHVVLAPNTTYTLQGEYSHAPGFPSEFTLELLAGGVSLGSDGGFPTVAGIFDTATVVVTTGATHPHLGEPLQIRITSSAKESDFDDIRLSTSTMSTNANVAIVNAGFEQPVQAPGDFTIGIDPPGWIFIGTTRRAVWNISNNPNGWFPNLAPEGNQVGALWAGAFVQTLDLGACAAFGGDTDGDGICDAVDNCPNVANLDQSDLDEDGLGDVCDGDADGDGELPPLDCNDLDPGIFTTAIEICTDGIDNDCDLLVDAADDGGDCDGDTVPNGLDNCPDDANPGQADLDNDGVGDVCDPDDDNDGYDDDIDNCPVVANDQADFDLDGAGDACDADADGDSVDDVGDLCLSTAASDTDAGVPSKRLGKNRWADVDGDGLFDTSGNNPTGRYYTIDDTAGCNCAQIIEACGYGQGHTKHGCSNSVMDWWAGSFDREGEPPYQCKD